VPKDNCQLDSSQYDTDFDMRDNCSAIIDCCFISEIYQGKNALESINECKAFSTYIGEFQGFFGSEFQSFVNLWAPELGEYEWTIHNFCQVYRNLTQAGQVPQTSFRMCECYGDPAPTFNSMAHFKTNSSSDSSSDFSDTEPVNPAHGFDTEKCTQMSGDNKGCVEIEDCCYLTQNLPSYKTSHNFCFNWKAFNALHNNWNHTTTMYTVCEVVNSTYSGVERCSCVQFSGLLSPGLALWLAAIAFLLLNMTL
jgi:hypothetical protein